MNSFGLKAGTRETQTYSFSLEAQGQLILKQLNLLCCHPTTPRKAVRKLCL